MHFAAPVFDLDGDADLTQTFVLGVTAARRGRVDNDAHVNAALVCRHQLVGDRLVGQVEDPQRNGTLRTGDKFLHATAQRFVLGREPDRYVRVPYFQTFHAVALFQLVEAARPHLFKLLRIHGGQRRRVDDGCDVGVVPAGSAVRDVGASRPYPSPVNNEKFVVHDAIAEFRWGFCVKDLLCLEIVAYAAESAHPQVGRRIEGVPVSVAVNNAPHGDSTRFGGFKCFQEFRLLARSVHGESNGDSGTTYQFQQPRADVIFTAVSGFRMDERVGKQ